VAPVTPPLAQPQPTPITILETQTQLGKFVRHHSSLVRTLGWRKFIAHLQHPSDHPPSLNKTHHPAAPYLHRLALHGVPAPSSSPPWTKHQLKTTLVRGAHTSAKHQFRDFLMSDMLDMVKKGYWSVLPFKALDQFAHLKLSPAGVVPQRTRRPRPIMDYSFTGVNQHSLSVSPMHAMQLGHALPRILQHIAYANPQHGPPLLLKIDLSDGYYRVRLSPEAALELAVVLPGVPPYKNLIGIPLCLPMGWTHSPPYFCAFTETAADIANHMLALPHLPPPHPLELSSQQHDVPRSTTYAPSVIHPPTRGPSDTPLSCVDVYIDDFIGLAQRPTTLKTLRTLLHSIDSLFRAFPDVADKPERKQIISASKLATGDGAWSTQKIILGWLIDTAQGTLSLPAHKAVRLQKLLHYFTTILQTA
jgi:hypothetical protein